MSVLWSGLRADTISIKSVPAIVLGPCRERTVECPSGSDQMSISIRTKFLLPVLLGVALTGLAEGPDDIRGTLFFGTYTGTDGRVQPARYVVYDDGIALEVSLALYGRTVVRLPTRSYDRDSGALELDWDGEPGRVCRLTRLSGTYYEGDCHQGELVMPMVIRAGTREDSEMMGRFLEPSATDIAILDRAIEILANQGARNTAGDRNCDDDVASGQVSLFCALFVSSIEVAGAYLHRRPAISAVRKQVVERYPDDYAHILRDVNNNPDLSDDAVVELVESARTTLLSRLDGSSGGG